MLVLIFHKALNCRTAHMHAPGLGWECHLLEKMLYGNVPGDSPLQRPAERLSLNSCSQAADSEPMEENCATSGARQKARSKRSRFNNLRSCMCPYLCNLSPATTLEMSASGVVPNIP